MESVFCASDKLHPLLNEVASLIKNRINSFLEVKSLSIDPKLSEIYTNLNGEDLFIFNEFYKAKGFRKLHLEIAKLGKGLQILHCVFFPDPCYELPIFGVDLVIASNSISAAIVDLSPVSPIMSELMNSKMKLINIPLFKEPKVLPAWGDIFSPYVCFVRPVDISEQKLFVDLIDEYLSVLFSLSSVVIPDKNSSISMLERLNFQKRYCLKQKLNDKTRTILTKFFGSSWAEEYIDLVLFDC